MELLPYTNYSDPLRTFWNRFRVWSENTFGPPTIRGPIGPIKHLQKEIEKELLPSPYDLEEYADCVFLIFDACRRAGFSYDELVEKIYYKFEKNQNRTWPDWRGKDPNAPIEHDRSNE